MRPFLISVAFIFAANASFAQNGWVLSTDGSSGDVSEGAIYIQELLDGYTDEGSAALYDTNSPEAKIEFCKSRLSYAERSLAQALSDFEYSVSISVKGAAPHNLGTECTLNSTRKAEIKLEGPTE
ncbi:hypothetical protein [Ruegeria arenilitoris]|uniref:hypothetical protein n=1 Tax=Ruegeria arenilitoris TaxID=1173585 RepID=UPI00147CA821|nr:hypothetical protein [Ruegeria arenilitoris]